jgi:putative oligomerization/nucleic acid binding protein
MSGHGADARVSDILEAAVPAKAASTFVVQWIRYPAIELCRCCFGTAKSKDDCDCHGGALMSGSRTSKVRFPPGLQEGQMLTLPRLVDHYPDRLDDLRLRIRMLPPEPTDKLWSSRASTRQRPAQPIEPQVLTGPLETDFPDRRLQTCQLAGGYGHNLRPDITYTLSVGRSAFGIFAEPPQPRRSSRGIGWTRQQRTAAPLPLRPEHVLPFRQLTDFRIWGPGAVTHGGGVIGGGFGLEGAAVGMLAATAINAATTRTNITTYLTVRSQREELTFLYASNTPHALQLELAHVFGALRLATATDTRSPRPSAVDPVDRLEKLGRLHAQGLLTDEEFAVAKRKLLGEL